MWSAAVISCLFVLVVYIMYDLLVFGRPLPKISTHDLNKALSCAGHMFIEFLQERIGSSCHSVWARLTVECVAGRKKRKEGGGRDWEGKLRRCTSGAWALSPRDVRIGCHSSREESRFQAMERWSFSVVIAISSESSDTWCVSKFIA